MQFVEQTSLKQKDAYNAILTYLAKNLGDSNFAIKVKDPDAGTIVTQISFDCSDLKGLLDPNRHNAVFNLEVGTKDDKVRFVYEAVSDRVYNGLSGQLLGEAAISSSGQMESLKTCVDRERAELLKSVNRAPASW